MNVRRRFRIARRTLDRLDQVEHALEVSRLAAVSPLLLRCGVVGAYLSNTRDGELDTIPLLRRLWSMSKTVAVPVVTPRQPHMNFYRLASDARLLPNRFGIGEPPIGSPFVHPLRLSLLFLPLVAFDDRGNRLGMGLGFYDRFLGRIPKALRPRLIGLAHEMQRSPVQLEHKPWDVPLDGVITEAGWQSFRREDNVHIWP